MRRDAYEVLDRHGCRCRTFSTQRAADRYLSEVSALFPGHGPYVVVSEHATGHVRPANLEEGAE